MRLAWPRSLAGQMALLLGLALLVAQAVNFALILNERQKLSLARSEAPAIARFVEAAADLGQARPEFRDAVLADASRRGARFAIRSDSAVPETTREGAIERRLGDALRAGGVPAAEVRAALVAPERPARGDRQALRLELRRADGRWLSARILTPRRDPWLGVRLGAATLLVYLIVLGASVWIALRLARPLRDLTRAAESFGGRGAAPVVEPRGPDDLRRAIDAFNAMNARLLALLDEKDRMLGAIGHDLRTPLASLRIRLEAMEPEAERRAAVAKVEETAAMLEDILTLARAGRAREKARPVDLSALVDTIVEEHRELGRDVVFEPGERIVAPVQAGLMRRALGNLIDNAHRYAGSARVELAHAGGVAEIRVIDRGPGLPPDDLDRVLEPFRRAEASRNRDTGGAGLGLAIARSIAESHGGALRLRPTEPSGTGLIAVLTLPVGGPTSSSSDR